MQSGFYDTHELQSLGLGAVGENVLISRRASLYNPQQIFLGSNIRIDDFCIITAREPVQFGNYVHVAAYSAIFGGAGFESGDFVGLSSRVVIYTESDDYSGKTLTSPVVPQTYKSKLIAGKVKLESYSIVGTASTLMPGVILREGSAVGAHSFVTKSCEPWMVYFGSPAKKLKRRSDLMKSHGEQLLKQILSDGSNEI